MKNLFGDNRISQILQCFRQIPVITVSTLAAKFQVSERTIRNDIKQLNQDLGGIASIEGNKGQYGLHIFSAEEFNKVFANCRRQTHFSIHQKTVWIMPLAG